MAGGDSKIMKLCRIRSGRLFRRKSEACRRRRWKRSGLLGFGCLLTHGFIRRLPNEPFVVPVQDTDEVGRYYLQFLDAYLVDVKTRFEDLS